MGAKPQASMDLCTNVGTELTEQDGNRRVTIDLP
jgi:hypothetical protein